MQIDHQYLYGFCPLARIIALRERTSLNAVEFAQLSGLEEFPNNGTMANYAIGEIKERLGVDSSCLTAEQRETLKAVRLTRKIHSNSNNMLLCERGKIARFNSMIDADSASFLKDLDILLTYKPINLLLHDELFKDMLYQRYQELGWNTAARTLYSYKPDELSKFTKEEVIDLFSKTEESLDRKRKLLASGELSLPVFNEGIPRNTSYPDRWADNDHINTKNEDICHCSHGGGFRYLQRILRGLHPGSELEHQVARGIQVHPNCYPWDRLNFYSLRSTSYFDTPAIITFDIKAEFLDGQPNGYEAGVRHEFFDQASKFKLENVLTGEVIEAANLVKMREEILKRKIGIGNF